MLKVADQSPWGRKPWPPEGGTAGLLVAFRQSHLSNERVTEPPPTLSPLTFTHDILDLSIIPLGQDGLFWAGTPSLNTPDLTGKHTFLVPRLTFPPVHLPRHIKQRAGLALHPLEIGRICPKLQGLGFDRSCTRRQWHLQSCQVLTGCFPNWVPPGRSRCARSRKEQSYISSRNRGVL